MRKIIFSALFIVACNLTGLAQAILPTTWGFDNTTLPTGWTSNSTGTYSGTGANVTPPMLKLDATGKYLMINYASPASTVSFSIGGNSFSGGTFTLEESVDGTTWTNVHVYTTELNSAGAAAYFTQSKNLLSTSRYVRFIYTTKVSGNVGLDNVSIAAAAATSEQEINIKDGSTTIVTGGNVTISGPVSTATVKDLTIENTGLSDALTITSAVISGANAADFTLGTVPTSVAAGASQTLAITFNPSTVGTKNAVLTIVNNDTDESTYIINLIGYPNGLATEPTVQATNLTFTDVKTYRFKGAFTPATGVDGYIVLRKNGSAITGAPVDGVVYQRGDIVGDAQVVYSGAATSFYPSNIVANSNYHFAVFTYNGSNTGINYNTVSPTVGVATTPATMMPATYYDAINTSNASFLTDLHNRVYPHTQRYYSDYISKFINLFIARDTVNNQKVITCVYSGENKVYTEPFIYATYNFSREHTYCHSWMPTYPNNEDAKEYSDYHHLFPTNQNEVNAVRGNYPLGVVTDQFSSYLGSKFGKNDQNQYVFEPRNEHKGDAARALFYQAIAYNTVDGNNWKLPSNISTAIPYGQDQAILKQWALADAPSNWEISRNDFIDSLQGNRNPFIDRPEYLCFINFSDMSYIVDGCTANVEKILDNAFIVYPNPAQEAVYLNVEGTTIDAYELYDVQGRKVKSASTSAAIGVKVDVSDVKPGAYIMKVQTPFGDVKKSIIIE